MGYSQELVGRMQRLKNNDQASIDLAREWAKYHEHIKKGGQPQRIDKYCHDKKTFRPLVVVFRRDFDNPLIFKQIVGWNDMPLKNFDIVQTTIMEIGIEMITTGAFVVCRRNSVVLLNDKKVYSLTQKDLGHILNQPSVNYVTGTKLPMLNDLSVFGDLETRPGKIYQWAIDNSNGVQKG